QIGVEPHHVVLRPLEERDEHRADVAVVAGYEYAQDNLLGGDLSRNERSGARAASTPRAGQPLGAEELSSGSRDLDRPSRGSTRRASRSTSAQAAGAVVRSARR